MSGTGEPKRLSLSVIVPSRNEESNLPRVLAMIAAQTRRPDQIVIADGMSTDRSRDLIRELSVGDLDVQVVDNKKQIVSAGLNAALKASSGDLVARMDTHAEYLPTYLEEVSRFLEENPGVDAVGGAMATEGRGRWGRSIASSLTRRFGMGGARHRVGGVAGPIQHVFSGCYRRTALLRIEGWDERFSANEDFEADLRVAASGGTIWLHPDARTTWYVRESIRTLAVQMWRYGWFKGLTLRLHPQSLSVRQLVPPLVLTLPAVLGLVHRRHGLVLWCGYLVSAATAGAVAAWKDGASPARGAVVPPVIHLSWGAGLIAGYVRFHGAAPRARNTDFKEG